MISHEDIFRTGIALLAFVVAFYAVIARERKTPYILNSIYAVTFVVLTALLLSLASKIVEPTPPATPPVATAGTTAPPQSSTPAPTVRARVAKALNAVAALILGAGIAFIFYRVLRIQNRQVNFRDDQLYYTIPLLLFFRRRRQRARRQKSYEHNAINFSRHWSRP